VTSIQNGTPAGTAFGRYTLIRPIGRGGMAEVWKAKIHGAQNFQRLVVVKRILPHLSSDPTFVRMFTDEAVLSARLNHPNIVQVFEFAEVAGEHYLAMEYVHGVNVGDIQKRVPHGQVPVGMAAHIVREVCLALAYAHGLTDDEERPVPVIHRDVSPSNVMIGYDGSVKLVDFGVAKVLSHSDEMTRTGALKGKVGYMSPEAIEGELELDGRTDLFSAGVLLHELLAGRRLFKGHDDLRTIALVRACRVAAPSLSRPEVPAELDAIVGKALARDREARYQSALAFAAELTQVVKATGWDAAATAAFLKEQQIQPGSEPELKAGGPAAAPASLSSPETMRLTVVERRGRSELQQTPRPLPHGGPGWALAGALGALGMTLALVGGWRFLGRGPAAAAERQSVDPGSSAIEVRSGTSQGQTQQAQPAQGQAAKVDVEVGVRAGGPTADKAGDENYDPDDVSGTQPRSVAPQAGRSGRPPRPDLLPAVQGEARAPGNVDKRRRRPPRRAPAPAAPAAEPPRINLKRGDVVPNF
jgi:serine/threonine protein kinase